MSQQRQRVSTFWKLRTPCQQHSGERRQMQVVTRELWFVLERQGERREDDGQTRGAWRPPCQKPASGNPPKVRRLGDILILRCLVFKSMVYVHCTCSFPKSSGKVNMPMTVTCKSQFVRATSERASFFSDSVVRANQSWHSTLPGGGDITGRGNREGLRPRNHKHIACTLHFVETECGG